MKSVITSKEGIMNKDELRELANALLKDDHGISGKAWGLSIIVTSTT